MWLTSDKEQTFTGKASAPQKKKGKQNAAKETLVQLQERFQCGDRVERDESALSVTTTVEKEETQPFKASAPASTSISHPLLTKQLKDGQNFIGFLQQLCQTFVWDLPEYEVIGETPEFICTCTVLAEGQSFSGEATSSQKKKAKYFAAKVVLLELQQYFQCKEV